MSDNKALLVSDGYFHIFNRAVGNEKIFTTPDNYRYFLKLFHKYIAPISDVFSYSLLPNHFHFFLRVKDEQSLYDYKKILGSKQHLDCATLPKFLLQQFSNYFNAYTRAYNKQQNRKGKLFMEPFNRKCISNTAYYTRLIHYIHANPVHHGYCNKVDEWPFTSYLEIVKNDKTFVECKEVIDWFGDVQAFESFHSQPIKKKFIES